MAEPNAKEGLLLGEDALGREAILEAPAKLNLFLKVLGVRPDGYRDLYTLMARLNLKDEIRLTPSSDSRDSLEYATLFETLGEPDEAFVKENLILKAIAAIRRERPFLGFFRVFVKKRIPIAAGLGGGSSDAAAILRHLGSLVGLNQGRLLKLALSIGSDAPFFLGPKVAIAEGRGEILTPYKGDLPKRAVLANPGYPLVTSQVFRELALTNGVDNNNLGPDFRLGQAAPLGRNDLLAPALRLKPDLAYLSETMASLGGEASGLSGSGPTFFALFREESEADRAFDRLKGQPFWSVRADLDLAD